MNAIRRHMQVASVIVLILMITTAQSAAAHAGHTHTDDGLDVSTTLGVAGTVVALGIAYVIASRVYRFRESEPGRESDQRDADVSG